MYLDVIQTLFKSRYRKEEKKKKGGGGGSLEICKCYYFQSHLNNEFNMQLNNILFGYA